MTADFTRIKEAYDRDGFVTVRQLLSRPDFERLNHELDRYIRDVVPTLPETHAFFVDRNRPETLKQLQHMGDDSFFRDYAHHAPWRQLAEALVGEPVRTNGTEWFNKPPGEPAPTPPHQDNYYFCFAPPNVVTLWMALDRVDRSNGCIRYVRGSHQKGIRPHGRSSVLGFSQTVLDYSEDDRANEVYTELEPGDVIAHHGNTIHLADPNRHPARHRRAFVMVFVGESCRRDTEAFARYQADLERQHRQLLDRLDAAGT